MSAVLVAALLGLAVCAVLGIDAAREIRRLEAGRQSEELKVRSTAEVVW